MQLPLSPEMATELANARMTELRGAGSRHRVAPRRRGGSERRWFGRHRARS